MVRQRGLLTRFLSGLGALVLLTGLTAQTFFPGTAFAAATQITPRELLLEDGSTDGGSKPGGTVNHKFIFTLNDTTDALGTIVFQYCKTAAAVQDGTLDCVAPTGMDTSGVTAGVNSGAATGWNTPVAKQGWDTANDSVYNAVELTRTAATVAAASTTLELDNIVNPTTPNTTFFVRIWTFTSTSITYNTANGTPLDKADANDYGTVAASTANPIVLEGTMPETLVFCTGQHVPMISSTVPDCSNATFDNAPTDTIPFNQLFSPSSTSYATSQMAAATNADSGYSITVNGPTLHSGTCADIPNSTGGDCIDPMATTAISQPDTRQFGMNLIDDANPSLLEYDGATTIAADPTFTPTYYSADGCVDSVPNPCGGRLWPVSGDATHDYYGVQDTGFDGRWPSGINDNTGDTGNYPTYTFKPNTPTVVASSDWDNSGGYAIASGTFHPTNTQRYTVTYIANVSGNQPAGSYTTTLTYICTPTF
jgi:hypothetical protein